MSNRDSHLLEEEDRSIECEDMKHSDASNLSNDSDAGLPKYTSPLNEPLGFSNRTSDKSISDIC